MRREAPPYQEARRAGEGGYDGSFVEHWLQSLLTQVFGFSDLHAYSEPQMIDERGFPITHHAFGSRVPMVFCAPGDKALDTADPRFGHEGRRRSPTGLLQEYLNANDQALWGLVSDGQRLRILRDNPSMTRPAYIEVDLATCFAEEQLPEFRILWLLLHASRFQPGTNNDGETSPSHCWLEQWRAEAEEQGERLLDKALADLGLSLRRLSRSDIDRGLAEMEEPSLPALYTSIGLGRRLAPLVARHFLASDAPIAKNRRAKPLAVEGTEGLVVEFAKCCHPVPGDAIHGQASVGRGLVVHRFGCAYSARKGASADRVELTWADNVSGEYDVELRVTASNKRGLLANLTAKFADADCNIEHIEFPESSGALITIRFLIDVRDRHHLAGIIRRVRRIPAVEKVERF